jgi:hypothetical protein
MKKNELNDSLFDQVLKYVADSEMEHVADSYPSEEELDALVSFSPAFEKRMKKFFRLKRWDARTSFQPKAMMKVGAAAVLFLVFSAVVVFNVDALRQPVMNMFVEWGNESAKIQVGQVTADYSAISDQLSDVYLPEYLPEGFSAGSLTRAEDSFRMEYLNANGTRMVFQSYHPGNNADIKLEGVQAQEITVNDEPALLLVASDQYTLIFRYDGHDFALSISAPVDREELFDTAASLKYWP